MDETTDLIRTPAGRVLIGCAENLQQGTEGAGGLDDHQSPHRPSFALLSASGPQCVSWTAQTGKPMTISVSTT